MEWELNIEHCKSLKELLAYRNFCKYECLNAARKIRQLEIKIEKFSQNMGKIDKILEETASEFWIKVLFNFEYWFFHSY